MYPLVPYEGLSWPITQHAGVISASVLRGLLEACSLCVGQPADVDMINAYLFEKNLLTANVRADSQRPDAWRDYQQILSEFGLIYSTKVMPNIYLTPIATAFIDGAISYDELITLQVLKYQYPNGHKSPISKSLRDSLGECAETYSSFTQLQVQNGILMRPAVAIWLVLNELYRLGESSCLTIDELQRYVVRCLTMQDVPFCIDALRKSRCSTRTLPALPRARRNMADWIKVLNNTPLFQMSAHADVITLSEYSKQNQAEINEICQHLADPSSFWIPTNMSTFKLDWFSFYGNIDVGIGLIPQENNPHPEILTVHNENAEDESIIGTSSRSVNLKPFELINQAMSENGARNVISMYDYGKTQRGYNLHNSMVNMIAEKCTANGATVSVDPKTIDLYVLHNGLEFLIEVKSITAKNFISRLRYAIGQVHQYNYLLPTSMGSNRRLALAFTAEIPSNSWSIPFVTDYLQMDLITLQAGTLKVRGNTHLARLVS